MSAGEMCSWCDEPATVELGTTEAACDAHKLENHPHTRDSMVTAALESGRMQIVGVSW